MPDDTTRLVDLTTSRSLGVIRQRWGPAYDISLNYHAKATPLWSADSSLLLWNVQGKWFPKSYVLVRVVRHRMVWQIDILQRSQEEILRKTREAAPDLYQKAKVPTSGKESPYLEGFYVNVKAVEPIELPLKVQVVLASNPKHWPNFPYLDSHMEALVDPDGKFRVTKFKLGEPPAGFPEL